ncbi:MAG: tetratricopeptide repeat protein [candidate division WOR-3 bacterium]
MKVKHRVSKEELKEDKFQEMVERVAAFYYANPKRFWTGVVVGLLVIIGGILFLHNRPRPVKNPEVELRLMDAIGNLFQGNHDYAERALKDLTGRFGKEYAGIKAHYYLGVLYSRSQPPRLDEAKREFQIFLKKAKKDPVLIPAAMLAIAICEEQQGNYLKAAKVYERVNQRYFQSTLGFEALLGAGRCYRKAGDLAKAERVYERYLKKGRPAADKAEEVKFFLTYIQSLKKKF